MNLDAVVHDVAGRRRLKRRRTISPIVDHVDVVFVAAQGRRGARLLGGVTSDRHRLVRRHR